MGPELISGVPHWVIVLANVSLLWSLPLKGVALWKSSRISQKKWFIVLFLVNTLGILELIYIFFVAKKYSVEVVESK